MALIHRLHQGLKKDVFRTVLIHTDLLTDDTLLLGNAFLRKIGRGDKLQKKLEVFPEILRAGEIIGGHIVAGKGVGHSAQCGKFPGDIPSGHIKELMLQIVGNPCRGGKFLSIQGKFPVDRAIVRDEIAQLFGKA